MEPQRTSALKLYCYLLDRHWNGHGLIGPDPGIRFNYRIWRFLKSYLRFIPWNDNYYYLQAQAYWVLANWKLFSETKDERYRDVALASSDYMLTRQRTDGAWDYPNPEWKGRVATVEGVWASIGLLETYRQTGNQAVLDGVLRWYTYMIDTVGFERNGEEVAVNYFAKRKSARVPNNSITVLRFLAELADATQQEHYLEWGAGLKAFIRNVQTESGEIPYAVARLTATPAPLHFQCFQYNAYQCLSLMRYYKLTGDPEMLPVIEKVLAFLSGGLGRDGHALYACDNQVRAVTYHAAALAHTFIEAESLGIHGYKSLGSRASDYVLRLQRRNGGVIHSRGDYYLLSDRRSYPRYLAMMLYHLLQISSQLTDKSSSNDLHEIPGTDETAVMHEPPSPIDL